MVCSHDNTLVRPHLVLTVQVMSLSLHSYCMQAMIAGLSRLRTSFSDSQTTLLLGDMQARQLQLQSPGKTLRTVLTPTLERILPNHHDTQLSMLAVNSNMSSFTLHQATLSQLSALLQDQTLHPLPQGSKA